jgi:AGZA family xanthine/uracil permease-like MFS transporter
MPGTVPPPGLVAVRAAAAEQHRGLPDLSLVGNVSFGAFGRVDALTVLLLLFTLVLANFVDAMGT